MPKNTNKGVTIEDVEYVAKLARLEFDQNEKQKFTKELNGILEYVDKLSEIDTENVDISIGAYKSYNALREDVEVPSLNKEEILKNAPETIEGFIKVPTIIE